MKKRIFRTVVLMLAFIMSLTMTVSATGTPSFTRWETNGEVITTASRDMYVATKSVNASALGLDGRLTGLNDIQYYNGYVYLLCSEDSCIVVLNDQLEFERKITIAALETEEMSPVEETETEENFDEYFDPFLEEDDGSIDNTLMDAEGIFVTDDSIFIMDTGNERLLQIDMQGNILQQITVPDNDVIPEDFLFQPISMTKDFDGNYYVVSKDCYYGALLYNSAFEFQGFYGANTVQATALDTLAYLWDLMTNTDEKRSKQTRTLPYAFNDITISNDGYLFTCNGCKSMHDFTNGTGQIQQLSPGGVNVLLKRKNKGKSESATGYMFLEDHVETTWNDRLVQDFCSIAINQNGFIFALDRTYGLVYVYDIDCNLVTAFGGGASKGDRLGLFKSPTSMTLMGDKILVADAELCSVTEFDITPYGSLLQQAQKLYLDGNYAEAGSLWEDVLKMDSACAFAYRGLARSCYATGRYKEAMHYAEKVYDYVTYDSAYQQVRKEFLEKNFAWIFAVAIVLIVALFYLFIRMKKHETSSIKNEKLRVLLHTSIHPFDSMKELKYKQKGSLVGAVVLLVLYTLTTIIRMTKTSFLFRTADAFNYNAFFTLASTAGLVLLFVVSNWLISTLMSGKGRFGEIFIATNYCLMPMVVINLLVTGLSYFLSYEDEALITGLMTVAVIFTLFLIIISNMTVHDYTFGQFILTTVITLFLMILIVFIIFMVCVMLQQFWNFIYSLYMEVAYR